MREAPVSTEWLLTAGTSARISSRTITHGCGSGCVCAKGRVRSILMRPLTVAIRFLFATEFATTTPQRIPELSVCQEVRDAILSCFSTIRRSFCTEICTADGAG